MVDFNWINAIPARDWSTPDRGWSVLTLSRREFARRSKLERDDDAARLFAEWAVLQLHRNYTLLADELAGDAGSMVIGMRPNPAVGGPRPRPARVLRRQWGSPPRDD